MNMTSTPFSVGLSDEPRLSSRVLRPPGGGHTDIFGSEPEPPRVGRRPGPNTAVPPPKAEEPAKPTNGASESNHNGSCQPSPKEAPQTGAPTSTPVESPQTEAPKAPQSEAPKAPQTEAPKSEPARMEAPKRVRVPPGGFSSGLCCSTDSAGFTSANDEEEVDQASTSPVATAPNTPDIDEQFPANFDQRYGGQYLTPDQLPEFCNQLHHLVEVIRNIQSYAKVTGEYPSELEKRLDQEAREVAALAGEARAARDVLARTRVQRRALQTMRSQLTAQLATLRHTEIRELEGVVRVSDRKLYKSWEAVKDSLDPAAYQPLLDEIKNKQTCLECLLRLVNHRRCSLPRAALAPKPLPPPLPRDDHESTTTAGSVRKRYDVGRRMTHKRKKRDNAREPRSVPLSGESSRHGTTVQVTVGQPSVELSTRASVRDILFFTIN